MADSPSTKPASGIKRPTLLPQGEHAGKPAMPLGAHIFTLIGSRNRAHLHLLSSTISRNHACIITAKSGVYVRDLASRNGVIVNSRKVKESELQDGDLVQVGSFKFKFQEPSGPIRLATTPRPPLAMLEMDGRALTPMDERTILIGRRPGCDITLDSPAVSNTHAIIFECDGKRYVRDLGSRTGTQVNGATVHQHALEIGDQVRIGSTTLRYIAADMPAIESEQTAEALPLEMESAQAAAHEESHAPVGLHFEEPAPLEAEHDEAFASVPLDEEQIPLSEVGADEAHHPAIAPPPAETATPIEFAADHSVELAPEVPVDEEIPLVQHDVTAAAAVIAEPAEDAALDFWTPESEHTITADLPAAEAPSAAAEEPVAEIQADVHAPEETPAPRESVEAPIDEWRPSEETVTEPTPDEPVAAAELPSFQTSIEADALTPLPAVPVALTPADQTPAEQPADEYAPLPVLDELEPVAAEPETSAAESPEAPVEPDLAESIAPPETEQPTHELAPTGAAEPELAENEATLPEILPDVVEAEPLLASSAASENLAVPEIAEAPAIPQAEIEPATLEPEPAPLRIEDVDLSAVKFEPEASEPEVPAEVTAEDSNSSGPLLDLLPPPSEQSTEDAAPTPLDVPEPETAEKRPGRAPRKRTRSPRRRKTERTEITASEPSLSEQGLTATTGEMAASEAASIDLTPTVDEAGFVAPESILPDAEPATSLADEPAIGSSEPALAVEPPAITSDDAAAEVPPAVEDVTPANLPADVNEFIADSAAAPVEPLAIAEPLPPADEISPQIPASTDASIESDLSPQPLEAHAEDSSEPAHAELQPALQEFVPSPVASQEGDTPSLASNPEPAESHEHDPEAVTDTVQFSETAASADHSEISFAVPPPMAEEPVGEWNEQVSQPPVGVDPDVPAPSDAVTPETEQLALAEPGSALPLGITSPTDIIPATENVITSATEPPVETIEGTEPTLESALDFEPSLEPVSLAADADVEPEGVHLASLSDSAFDAIVADFAGPEAGSLVEETNVAPSAPSEMADEPVAAKAQTESPLMLAPLGGAELPPLELGAALTFSSEESKPTAEQHVVANEAVPKPPVEISSTALAFDAGFTTSEGIEPTISLEMPADFALDLESPPPQEPSFDAGLEWEEPVGLVPQMDASGLEFEDQPLAFEASAPVEPVANAERATKEPVHAEPAALSASETAPPTALADEPPALPMRPPMNPFFGMERDLGTFIGGMPLQLAPPGPQPAVSVVAPAPSEPAVPVASTPPRSAPPGTAAPLTFDEEPNAELDLDKLFEGEEPLELFDETADQLDKLPDLLDPINDIGGAIGESLAGGEVTPPEPVRSVAPAAPLRSLTADPAAVLPKPPTTTVTVPPFAGARPMVLPGGNPFAGLAGIRPTDVFSQTAFPTSEEPTFKAHPIDIPPMAPTKPPGAAFGAAPGFSAGAPGPKTDGDAVFPTPPAHRPIAPRPTAAMMSAGNSDRHPWWKNVRVLLPLLVLLIIAAVVVIIRFFPPKTLVQGTLQIKGIDDRDLGVYARREQINNLRKTLLQPGLRETVLQRLHSEGISPGFVQSADAFEQLADPSSSPFEGNRLLIQRPQTDGKDDQRMAAVLQAVYLANKTAAEQTSQVRGEAAVASQKFKTLDEKVKAQQDALQKMSDQVKATAGTAAAEVLSNPTAAVQMRQQQNVDLHRALEQANAEVKRKHDEWEHAQEAAQQGANSDPKLMQIRQNMANLDARLTVARVSASAQLDPAKAFDEAVQAVDRELTLIASSSSKNPALASYVVTARLASTDIHSLLDIQKQDSDRIADLRQQLAGHREAHLRQVWAADETLKGLLEERDAQAHRFGAASDSGYAQDAARIHGVLDELDQKVEARRQSLATTGQSSDDLQQNLEQTIEHLRSDQHDNDAKIAAALGRLDIPPVGKLEPADEKLLQQLNVGQDVAAAGAAYAQYASGAKPSAQDAQSQIRKLEADLAEQQAQLDAYEQRSDAKAAVATARQALDAAQDAEAKAQAAYAANLNVLITARQVKDAQLAANDLTTAKDAAARDAQAKATEAGTTPILLPPDPQSSVQAVTQPDQRVWYLAGAIGLIALLFAGPLWMAARESRADVPYATLERRREPMIESSTSDDEQLPVMDDDEHPALT